MKETVDEKEFLIFYILLLVVAFGVIICTNPALCKENGTIWNEPVKYKLSKSAKIEFTIKNSPGLTHVVRFIYADLDKHQKEEILNLKRGTFIEMHVDNCGTSKNGREVYAIKTNDKIIYSLVDYEYFQKRKLLGSIAGIFLFSTLLFLHTKSKWKDKSCLLSILTLLSIIATLVFIVKGYSF